MSNRGTNPTSSPSRGQVTTHFNFIRYFNSTNAPKAEQSTPSSVRES
jgi:hypothetical protein